ncbi:MAG: hypothetical protein M0Z70_13255 [Nitrospiraceae bacterium]|nr:hypothetical protein [Nitrospiraceae bacterium]
MKFDSFVKAMLVLIVLFLGIIAIRPFVEPEIGYAGFQSGIKFGHVHIGVGSKYLPDGSTGAWVVDLRNGNVWGFRNYDTDPVYLGKFKFEALDQPVKK